MSLSIWESIVWLESYSQKVSLADKSIHRRTDPDPLPTIRLVAVDKGKRRIAFFFVVRRWSVLRGRSVLRDAMIAGGHIAIVDVVIVV